MFKQSSLRPALNPPVPSAERPEKPSGNPLSFVVRSYEKSIDSIPVLIEY